MASVLICDDAAFMRMTIRKILEKSEFEVVGEAEDGLMAVKLYEELKPDIVTMDITMPQMDGVAAVREIKKSYPDAKIVMISAMGQQTMVLESIEAGASNFLVKPFKEEKIISILHTLL